MPGLPISLNFLFPFCSPLIILHPLSLYTCCRALPNSGSIVISSIFNMFYPLPGRHKRSRSVLISAISHSITSSPTGLPVKLTSPASMSSSITMYIAFYGNHFFQMTLSCSISTVFLATPVLIAARATASATASTTRLSNGLGMT
jgi:hypothetical protein